MKRGMLKGMQSAGTIQGDDGTVRERWIPLLSREAFRSLDDVDAPEATVTMVAGSRIDILRGMNPGWEATRPYDVSELFLHMV